VIAWEERTRPGNDQVEPRIENRAQSRPTRSEFDIRPDGDPQPLFDDGAIVDVVPDNYSIRQIFKGGQTLELRCQVLSEGGRMFTRTDGGELVAVELSCYFRLPEGKRDGRMQVRTASKFYRAWTLANGNRRPSRRDRMRPDVFIGRLLRAQTRVVKTDSRNRKLPKDQWYSVIDGFLP
jgi:hypothetical protein